MSKNRILLYTFFASFAVQIGLNAQEAASQEAASQEAASQKAGSKVMWSHGSFPDSPSSQLLAQEASTVEAAEKQPAVTTSPAAAPNHPTAQLPAQPAEGPVINFNNVSITEFLRFVSRLTGKNFIFDPDELQFPVTIVSESSASLEDVMAALLQNLRIHNFYLIEEGGNFIIHKNTDIRAPASLLYKAHQKGAPEIATQVFHVQNVNPERMAAIIKAMTSADAIVQVVEETNRIVVTDFLANLLKIADITKQLDAPSSELEIGQYVALNNAPNGLIAIAERLLTPLALDKTLVMVPYTPSNSIFIVSTPFFVEKTLALLQALDLGQVPTGSLNINELKFDRALAEKMRQAQATAAQQRRGQPVFLTPDELEALTERERIALLHAKGLTPQQIAKMTPQEMLRYLREHGVTPQELEQILGPERAGQIFSPGRIEQIFGREQLLGPPGEIARQRRTLFENELPLGQVESTQFLLHKLQYRKADSVTTALKAIADSLLKAQKETAGERAAPSDLIVTLNSVQPIEENNTLVFTGTRGSLQKVKELITQVDIPVRQVMIEGLVLDTTIDHSLNFGVEWGAKLQRKNFAGQGGLITANSTIAGPLQAIGFPPAIPTVPPTVVPAIPLNEGFSVNSIGRKIKFHGTGFIAGAAVIQAIKIDDDTKIILNPKIVTEHNVPAEIFVGQQIPIKGQSIVNSTNANPTNTVATNFNTQNVGVRLKVTPLITSSDMVTLIIDQDISSANQVQVNNQGQNNAPPATINEIHATTRVHVPSGYFLMMSGLLQTTTHDVVNKVPILGSIPIIGFFFSNKTLEMQKRNVILYLRPTIIDTPLDIERITKREQQLYKEDNETVKGYRDDLQDLKQILNF
jgi:type III secretion protein C